MPDYSAGDASLRIVPDAKEFKSLLEADMRKIRAEFRLNVTADTGQARADINRFREVASREGLRLGVDVALAQAKADMDGFRERQRRDGMAIKVDLEDSEARAKLAELRARERAQNVKVKVDADTGGALERIEKLDKAFESILGTLGSGLKLNLTIAGIGELPAATLMIAQLTGAVEQLSQAGLVLPGVFAGIGASVGTLALGLNGIKDAYDAVAKAAKPTLSEQAQNAREVTAATNAHRNAVADEAQAERDRTRAVKDARFALEDLNLQLRGGKISEQQAVNNALRQRRDLQRDMAKGQIKDQLDLQQRLLDIQEADQGVAEAHQRNLETQEKWNDAQQKGIANSDAVVQANEHVLRAQQNVAQTSDALAEAVAKPGKALADAMANLSPNAQKVITTLKGAQQQFLDFGNDIQDKVTGGIGDGIKTLIDSDLPHLQAGMGSIATAWNGTLKQLFASLGSDSSKGLLDRILGDTAKAQTEFTKAIDPLVHGIGTLTAAGADALPRLADAVGSVATRFDKFISDADKDGRLDKWINDGLTGFTKLGDTLLNIGSAIHSVTKAAGGGDGLLTVLSRGTKQLADFLKSTEGQNKLKQWFEEGRREIQDHIIPILQSLPGVFKGVLDVGTQIANIVVPPLRDISHFLGEHPKLIKDVVTAFLAWKGITGVASLITDLEKINSILGTKGAGKKGLGGKGILGKIGIFAATLGALHVIDDLSDDGDAKPPTAGDTGTNVASSATSGAVFGGSVAGVPGAIIGTGAGAIKGLYDSAAQDVNAAKQRDANDAKKPGPNQNFVQHPLLFNPDGGLKPAAGDELRAKIAAGQLPGYSLAPDGTIIGPDGKPVFGAAPRGPVPAPTNPLTPDDLGGLLHYVAGGATPTAPGPLPDGGYHAVVHPREFVQSEQAVDKYGVSFMNALNAGVIDPKALPHYDQGWMVGPDGNPVNPGMLPGPSDPSVYQPIAPNPMANTGVSSALGSFMSGLGGPIQNLTGLISTAAGQQGGGGGGLAGGAGAFVPGLWGLGAAMQGGDAGMQAWGQQTGDWLANWGAKTLTQFGGALYKGVLDFFGLGNSILSPSNSWFQAGAQSLGVFDKLAPLFGWGQGDGSGLQIGSQSIGVGPNGESIDVPTFGTSVSPGGSAGGPGIAAPGGDIITANAYSHANFGGNQPPTITPELLAQKGFAPLYSWADNDQARRSPDWVNKLASQFGLVASTYNEGDTLHHGGFAWDFNDPNAPPGADSPKLDAFASFIQSNLSGQTLQLIHQNPATGQHWGIAAGTAVGPGTNSPQYFSSDWAGHSNHVHWATDAPVIITPPGSATPWWAPGTPAAAQAGALPVQLPAGIPGGGRGAGLNLALAAQGGPQGETQTAVFKAMLATGFPPSEWAPLKQIVDHESSWKIDARNPSSGAFGLFQFLGHQSDLPGGYSLDPAQQALAGMTYIKGRYGSPSAAWDFWQKHHWYADGGASRGPGGPKGDQIPAMLSDNEHVLTSDDVNAMGGQDAVYRFRAALHRADGGPILVQHFAEGGGAFSPLLNLVNPNPPKPVVGQLPDVQHITTPPRASAVIPTAPTTPLPAPIGAPPPPSAPVQPQTPQADDQQAPLQGPVTVGSPNSAAPGPNELNHNLAAINTGIASGASTLGNIAATAAALGLDAAGGGAGAGAGLASSMIAGLFQQGGKIATNLVNIGSSLLVGNVPGSFGDSDRAYGHAVRAQQKVPVTAPSGDVTHNTFNGMDVNRVFQELDIRQAQAQQARMAKYGG